MLFNSPVFALFFPLVFCLYWSLPHGRQNRLLLAASYIFYGWWDWRFLGLILLSTAIDYYAALKIEASDSVPVRKKFLLASIGSNLFILGFFKYFNFFADNFRMLFAGIGFEIPAVVLHIVLPVGISFYTFQSMSYTIDVYRKNIPAEKDFMNFALYVSFFPQLVAGPIERASTLMPQVNTERVYKEDQATEGCWLFLWGLFQKMVLADSFARITDPVFASSAAPSGAVALIGVYAFAFQIFCDFAGYSNMARGLAKLLGFELMINFRSPYFVSNPSDFWENWHISLSTWLKDYVYIPMGGNRGTRWLTGRNLLLTMLLGGLWHGAAWTFVVWGLYHGLLLLAFRLLGPRLSKSPAWTSFWKKPGAKILGVLLYFQLTCVGWLYFRAGSLGQAHEMLGNILSGFSLADLMSQPSFRGFVMLLIPFFAFELFFRFKDGVLSVLKLPFALRWPLYITLFYAIFTFGVEKAKAFVYFQF